MIILEEWKNKPVRLGLKSGVEFSGRLKQGRRSNWCIESEDGEVYFDTQDVSWIGVTLADNTKRGRKKEIKEG
jgi:hypothetical protein